MATPLTSVFDAFLGKIDEDQWIQTEDIDVLTQDWMILLDAAIFNFKYPRVPLDYDKETKQFTNDLTNDEIQILANLMKFEWLSRCIDTWDNIRFLYSDKDFSQANFLDKLNDRYLTLKQTNKQLLDKYNREVNYKPNKIFQQLAGK